MRARTAASWPRARACVSSCLASRVAVRKISRASWASQASSRAFSRRVKTGTGRTGWVASSRRPARRVSISSRWLFWDLDISGSFLWGPIGWKEGGAEMTPPGVALGLLLGGDRRYGDRVGALLLGLRAAAGTEVEVGQLLGLEAVAGADAVAQAGGDVAPLVEVVFQVAGRLLELRLEGGLARSRILGALEERRQGGVRIVQKAQVGRVGGDFDQELLPIGDEVGEGCLGHGRFSLVLVLD